MNPGIRYQHALINRIQTLLQLAVMAVFLALLGWLLWGIEGIFIMLLAGIILMLLNPVFSPQFIMSLYRAQKLSATQVPELHLVLAELAQRSGLKVIPELYYIPSRLINSFAVGRPGRAAVAVTDGLLRSLDLREVAGVLAHEISHIRCNDMLVMGLADLFCRMTSSFSLVGQIFFLINLPLMLLGVVNISWLVIIMLLLAPLFSTLAQLGLSRTREYEADLNAARLTDDPEGLARALIKIDRVQGGWLERLFLPGRGIPEPSMLRTHPPTDERVRRLLSLNRPSEKTAQLHKTGSTPLTQNLSVRKVKRRPGWHITGLWH